MFTTTLQTHVYITCTHGFLCAFPKGKCSSWAGHLVMGVLQNRADGTKPCIHFAQYREGFFAYWWPLALLTIWYFPNAKCILQLWKIFSLTSNLTINNFFYCFSPPWAQLLLGCCTERAVCQALTCLAQRVSPYSWFHLSEHHSFGLICKLSYGAEI